MEHFSTFHHVLVRKIQIIRRELGAKPETAHVKDLQILPEQWKNVIASPGARWHSLLLDYHQGLAILTGVLKGNVVGSEFYLGDHHNHGFGETVVAEWVMDSVKDFIGAKRDTHSAILLTALGIDALERGCSYAVYSEFFGAAMLHISDVERQHQLTEDMENIKVRLKQQLLDW
jgi:hypothetical protein